RYLFAADVQVERGFVLLVVPVIPQHQHAHRLQEKTPHHAKRIRLAQQVEVAAAEHDRRDLQQRDEVDDAERGAVLPLRLAEPVDQDAVFRHAVHYAVGSDYRGVHRARKNQHTHDHYEHMKQQAQNRRTGQVHGQAAQQIVDVALTDVTWDD